MRNSFFYLSLSFLLSVAACGPRSARTDNADLTRQLEQLAPGPQVYPPPTSKKPLPVAAGQWVKQHVVDKDGQHSLVTSKVLALHGQQVWLETETESASGTRAIKVRVSLGDRKNEGTIEIYEYWRKQPDGSVEEIPAMVMGNHKAALRSTLASILVGESADSQTDVTVPAGLFQRAYTKRVTAKVLGGVQKTDVWWHAAVPLNGRVLSQGVGSPARVELVAFGTEPRASLFP